MSAARVTLEIVPDDDKDVDAFVEAFWEALRDAGIDGNVTVVLVEHIADGEDE